MPAPDHEDPENEDADHDRRDAVEDVQHDLEGARNPRSRVLGDVDRDEHGHRDRYQHRHADDERAPDQRVGDAALLAVQRSGLREEVEVQRAEALYDERAENDHEDPAGEHRGGDREDTEDLLDDAAPSQPVRLDGDVEGIDRRQLAHTALLARSNRTTMNCAMMLAASEITIRIAAR